MRYHRSAKLRLVSLANRIAFRDPRAPPSSCSRRQSWGVSWKVNRAAYCSRSLTSCQQMSSAQSISSRSFGWPQSFEERNRSKRCSMSALIPSGQLLRSIRLYAIRIEVRLTLPAASRCQLDCRPRSKPPRRQQSSVSRGPEITLAAGGRAPHHIATNIYIALRYISK